MTPTRTQQSDTLITLSWLVRLRWGAVGAQLFTILVSSVVLGVLLPMGALTGTVAVTALTNVLVWRRLQSPPAPTPRLIAGLLLLDTALLTVMLAFSGGPSNPFVVLYLLHVTLAATMLDKGWGFAVAGLAAACFALLFPWHVPLPGLDSIDSAAWRLHLRGTWVAVAVTASVITYFVARVAEELRQREQTVARMQEQLVRDEKLASLTTLAAGAAHELGTPLATIAVVSKELERSLAKREDAGPLADDARLIREQVERCRGILLQMSAKAGESLGEVPGELTVDALAEKLRGMLGADRAARFVVTGSGLFTAPREALALVLASVVRNAFEASDSLATVALSVKLDAAGITFDVRDRGHGMPPDVLSRAGDPFFSTKPTGQGMGLGLFLARAFAERLGGGFSIESVPGEGTHVQLSLPPPPRTV